MKKVCIALDYNPTAKKVAKMGADYATALGAEIYLVHVLEEAAYYAIDYIPVMGYENSFSTSSLSMVKELKDNAEAFLNDTKEQLNGKRVNTKVLEGTTAEAILEFSMSNNIDLIVLGTHSHSVVENVLMGNTAVKIVRHSHIPLLVIPNKEVEND